MSADRDLFDVDADLDRLLTLLDDEFAASLASVLKTARRRVQALVATLTRTNGRLVSTRANLAIAREAERVIRAALQEAGYDRLVAQALGRYPDLLDAAFSGARIDGAVRAMTAFDLQTLEAFHALKLQELGGVGTRMATSLRDLVMKGVMGAQAEAEVVSEIAEVLDATAANARTLYETGLSEFVRTVVLLQSDGEADEAFLYSGPVDARCRPFCLERVGKVWTRKTIEAWDNGQLGNTMLTLGGYNCRHIARRVSELSDMRALADTGDVVSPFYAKRIAATKAAQEQRPQRTRRAA